MGNEAADKSTESIVEKKEVNAGVKLTNASEDIHISSTNFKKIEHWLQAIASFVAVSGLVISLLVLFQGNKHNKLSVQPHLDLWYTKVNDGNTYGDHNVVFSLSNNGLGPAIITNYEIYLFDGENYNKVPFSLSDPFLAEEVTSKTENIESIKIFSDTLAQAGEGVEPSSDLQDQLSIKVDQALYDSIRTIDETIVIAVCYQSLYGESGYVDSRNKPINNRLINECNKKSSTMPPVRTQVLPSSKKEVVDGKG